MHRHLRKKTNKRSQRPEQSEEMIACFPGLEVHARGPAHALNELCSTAMTRNMTAHEIHSMGDDIEFLSIKEIHKPRVIQRPEFFSEIFSPEELKEFPEEVILNMQSPTP